MASSDSENSFRTASSGYSDSECGSDSTSDGGSMLHIQPYMFEPKRAVSESSDVAKGPAGHAEQDHNIANMSFCKILKNSIHIISMKIKSIGPMHPLTIHSFQFYD